MAQIPTSILIADDDPLHRHLLQLVLATTGYPILEATDGEALIQLARRASARLALILTDQEMPYRSGSEAIRILRAEPCTAHLPMILVSGRSDAAAIVAGLTSGADDYIVKPWRTQELLACIARHLHRP